MVAWVKPAVTNEDAGTYGGLSWNGFEAITKLWDFVPRWLYWQLIWGL